MKRIPFRLEDTQEYQDLLRQKEAAQSRTPATAIAQALQAKNVGPVAADPSSKAQREYDYATQPPEVVRQGIAMLPESMQSVAEFFAPSRADLLTAGASKLGTMAARATGLMKPTSGAMQQMAEQVLTAPQSLPIRQPKENVRDVARATFDHYKVLGNSEIPTERLVGGVRHSDASDKSRVEAIVNNMRGPDGYIERLIVDDAGNVLEGQHRLEAIRALQLPSVPVVVIADTARDFDIEAMKQAIRATGKWHPDQVNQLANEALRLMTEFDSADEAIAQMSMPPPFDVAFTAALRAARKRSQ